MFIDRLRPQVMSSSLDQFPIKSLMWNKRSLVSNDCYFKKYREKRRRVNTANGLELQQFYLDIKNNEKGLVVRRTSEER